MGNPTVAVLVGAFVHLHSSGRYDRSWRRWWRDLGRLIRALGVSVITATETRNRHRALLRPGWRRRSAGDAAVGWRTRRWRYVAHLAVRVAPDAGYFKPSIAMLVVLHDRRHDVRWIHGAWHAPVIKDGPEQARDEVAGRAVYAAAVDIHDAILDLIAEHDVDAVNLGGDWNERLTNPADRQMLRGLFPSLHVAVPRNYRGPGTGESRISVIDGSLVSARVEVDDWRVLPRIASSDHSPVAQTLSLRPVGRKGADRMPQNTDPRSTR